LGGYQGYRKTPVRIVQECQLSIIAEWNYQAEQDAKLKEEQEQMKRDLDRQKRGIRA
jgi:hypothetical protein